MRAPHGIVWAGGRLYVTGTETDNAFRVSLVKPVPLPPAAPGLLGALLSGSGARILRRRARSTQ